MSRIPLSGWVHCNMSLVSLGVAVRAAAAASAAAAAAGGRRGAAWINLILHGARLSAPATTGLGNTARLCLDTF